MQRIVLAGARNLELGSTEQNETLRPVRLRKDSLAFGLHALRNSYGQTARPVVKLYEAAIIRAHIEPAQAFWNSLQQRVA